MLALGAAVSSNVALGALECAPPLTHQASGRQPKKTLALALVSSKVSMLALGVAVPSSFTYRASEEGKLLAHQALALQLGVRQHELVLVLALGRRHKDLVRF
jgi:hypothetical protein